MFFIIDLKFLSNEKTHRGEKIEPDYLLSILCRGMYDTIEHLAFHSLESTNIERKKIKR
jgi:hypothetical protein